MGDDYGHQRMILFLSFILNFFLLMVFCSKAFSLYLILRYLCIYVTYVI